MWPPRAFEITFGRLFSALTFFFEAAAFPTGTLTTFARFGAAKFSPEEEVEAGEPFVELLPFTCSFFELFRAVIRFSPQPIRGCAGLCKRIFVQRLRRAQVCAYGARVRHFIIRWLVTTVAVMVASALLSGIRYDSIAGLLGAALLLGILNAFVRPILLLLSAPLILFTLGLFILVVNGLLLLWVPTFVRSFHVDSFGSAFWGAIVIGIVSWMLSAFFRGSDGRVHVLTHHGQIKRVQGRVVNPKEGNR